MRPKIKRYICPDSCPKVSLFKPNGIPASELVKIKIEDDEFEAIRLVDLAGLAQQDAALKMCVSRQTFANILKSARLKITDALINGNALLLPEKPISSIE